MVDLLFDDGDGDGDGDDKMMMAIKMIINLMPPL